MFNNSISVGIFDSLPIVHTIPGQVLVVNLRVEVRIKRRELVHALSRLVPFLLGSLPLVVIIKRSVRRTKFNVKGIAWCMKYEIFYCFFVVLSILGFEALQGFTNSYI
jgi:hypothetical protein